MRRVPFARPSIGAEEINAVTRVLESGWLTTGAEALAFEREFSEYLDVPYALAVNSATAGLHLALEACGVGAGDLVIVPSLTFTATAEVARYLHAELAFADIEPDGFLVDADAVEARAAAAHRAGQRVGAIVVVHLAGEVVPIARFREIADRYGAALIEDAAHAFPATDETGYAGTLGDVGVFSFYANKTITTGEGGMIVTASSAIAERIATMRLHGIDREAWDRYSNPRASWRYDVVAAGYKYNMPDTAAAIGRVQLRRAEELRRARREIADRYRLALAPLEKAGVIALPPDRAGHAWHLFIVRLLDIPIHRDALIAELAARGIGTSVHYVPLHHMSYWATRYPEQTDRLPNTDRRFEEIISLPLFPDLTVEDQNYVIDAVTSLCSTAAERTAP